MPRITARPREVLWCDVARLEGEARVTRTLSPSECRSTTHDVFFRQGNDIVLEARSILYAVRLAGNSCPLRRLLILSHNLALVLALCKGRSNIFTMHSVVRAVFGYRQS